jgi:hypothetical protein
LQIGSQAVGIIRLADILLADNLVDKTPGDALFVAALAGFLPVGTTSIGSLLASNQVGWVDGSCMAPVEYYSRRLGLHFLPIGPLVLH